MSEKLSGSKGSILPALAALASLNMLSCQKGNDAAAPSQTVYIYVDSTQLPANAVADVDGNVYSTVTIGSQRWMAENLRTNHYTNGDLVPYRPDNTEWAGLPTGAWTNYDTDAAYDGQYGKLYNWYTVVDPRNVCPSGWHVPSDSDWMELESSLGLPLTDLDLYGDRGSVVNVGGQLKSTAFWSSPNTGANDSSGFSGYPGGTRLAQGTFNSVSTMAIWWSASEHDTTVAWLRELLTSSAGVSRLYHFKTQGCSIRCVED